MAPNIVLTANLAPASRSQERNLRFSIESFYALFTLIYLSSAFQGISTPADEASSTASGDSTQLLLQIVVYSVAGFLLLRRWNSVTCAFRQCKWAIALVVIALLSASWADDPVFVLRKVPWAVGTLLFGIYLGTRYKRHEQVTLVYYAVAILCVLSIVIRLRFPDLAIDSAEVGAGLRGVFQTKNMLGRVMALGVLACCCLERRKLLERVVSFAWIAGFMTVSLLSQSATGVIVGVLAMVIVPLYRSLRLPTPGLIATVMACLMAVTLFAGAAGGGSGLVGSLFEKDDSLTGRVPLWDSVLRMIPERPVLGWGYSSFWAGDASPSAAIVKAVGWNAPHSHNGFLDLWLDLGLVGLITFVMGLMIRFKSAILDYRAARSHSAVWPLAFLTFMLLYNIDESTLRLNNVFWALYTACMVRDVLPAGRNNSRTAQPTK